MSMIDTISDLYVLENQSTILTCPIESSSCGDLHSIRWYKGTDEKSKEEVAIVSGDGQFTKVYDPFKER
jgi:hypothetical protein